MKIKFLSDKFSSAGLLTTTTLISVALLWNRNVIPFWGDDYIAWFNHNFNNGFASDVAQSLFQTGQQKYRPIFQVAMAISLGVFKNNLLPFVILNITLLILLGLVVGFIFRTLLGYGKFSLSFGILLVATSRFTWFSTSHAIGLLETLSGLFVGTFILFSIYSIKNPNSKNFLLAGIFFGLAIFTHERYILLGVFSSIFFLFRLRSRGANYSLFPFLPFIMVIFNFGLKALIFNVNILQGSHFNLALTDSTETARQTLQNIPRIIKSLIGFSEYVQISTKFTVLFTLVVLTTCIAILLIRQDRNQIIQFQHANHVDAFFLFLMGIGAQIPASLEPALQERFLLIPYICFVSAGIVFLTRYIQTKGTLGVLSVGLCAIFFIYAPNRYTYDYSENSARILFQELEPSLNSANEEPWYLIVRNYGVGLWMFGTMRNYEPGVLSQFPNPPVVFWEGTFEQIPNNATCKLITVDPIYLPQVTDCPF